MKVYNTRIETGLGLHAVTAGLAGEPAPNTPRGEITPHQYAGDDTRINALAAQSLLAEINKGYDGGHYPFSLSGIFNALAYKNRAILYSGRFVHAMAETALRESVPHDYVHLAYTAISEHGTKIPSTYPRPMLWVITDKVVKIPDVEQYATKDDTRGKLSIPLNFEITDYSAIRIFSAS